MGKVTSTPKRRNCPKPTMNSTKIEPEENSPLVFCDKFSTIKISRGIYDNSLDLA